MANYDSNSCEKIYNHVYNVIVESEDFRKYLDAEDSSHDSVSVYWDGVFLFTSVFPNDCYGMEGDILRFHLTRHCVLLLLYWSGDKKFFDLFLNETAVSFKEKMFIKWRVARSARSFSEDQKQFFCSLFE